jgi:hypothetical protein
VAAIGILLFLLGVRRFFVRHHFGLDDALYCCLAIIPAGLLLLVFDYVLHHAPLVVVIPFFLAVVLIFSSPVFDVALGLVLFATIAFPAFNEWKQARRL